MIDLDYTFPFYVTIFLIESTKLYKREYKRQEQMHNKILAFWPLANYFGLDGVLQ